MPIESGVGARIYSLAGLGDSSGRGREVIDRTVSCATTDTLLLPNNNQRVWALLVNTGANDVFLRFGEAATLHTGIPLLAAGGWVLINFDMAWSGSVNGIAETAASVVAITEVSLQSTTPEPTPIPPGSNVPTIPNLKGC